MALFLENRQKQRKISLVRLRQAAKKILQALECNDKDVNILLVDNEEIRKLNKDYLNRDYPTNVISFSQTEGEFGDLNPKILGDIVISVEKASHDADRGGLSLEDELDFLVIHGLLHLLGYNHEGRSEVEAKEMEDKADGLFFLLKGYRVE